MSWLLEQISIEGFRGINNAGDPLALKFDPDKVNSVSAPNGVGKSSIFEAISYALTGSIPKLDSLQAAEKASTYYLNQFHPANVGTISLHLRPVAGGQNVTITVNRHQDGGRTVTTSDGSDGATILNQLNREFVLLDAKTFQKFIDDAPLERGRSFSGLLGLGAYSTLRQALQSLSHTQAFNNHFEVGAKTGKKALLVSQIAQARDSINESYGLLVGTPPSQNASNDDLRSKGCETLLNIPTIKAQCDGRSFDDISPDECLTCIRDAEGGPARERLAGLLQKEASLKEAIASLPEDQAIDGLIDLARKRDEALKQTQGDLFLRLYKLTEEITGQPDWADKTQCPACDRTGETSVLEHAQARVALYDAVSSVSARLAEASAALDWSALATLEKRSKREGESPVVDAAKAALTAGTFTEASALELQTRLAAVKERATEALTTTIAEKGELENQLPPSLVAITEKVEAARRLQGALSSDETSRAALDSLNLELQRIERVKEFLAETSKIFAKAETDASSRRLAAVEPLCREYFESIVFDPVVPAIAKRPGSENLTISLATFHDLHDVSAQSLLPESYRNAFAISVYLAAAALYGGSARFLILDDVTSSLDAGHQYYLMEAIRTKFSRPENPNGPQVIILSHDTLLEKYFNTNSSTAGWSHQRIEGSPRTAVLPQSNAVNRVREATLTALQAGNVQDAAPRIRQYLEYVLEQIIVRCRIPVPMDVALTDEKRMAGHLLKAIEAQVKLHAAASSLVLETAQVQGLNVATATIMANFLSHWSTGQTQAFAAGPLVGAMQAIDAYADCFKFEPTPGAARKFYKSLSEKE